LARREGAAGLHSLALSGRYGALQGRHRLELSVLHEFELALAGGALAGHSTGYWYHVQQKDGPEIVAFHWHPGTVHGPISYPHLHIGQPTSPIDIGSGRHVPTGRVSIEAVVRFLIKELHVRPLRSDWESVIADNEAGIDAVRAW
jgi:hypothetical protein